MLSDAAMFERMKDGWLMGRPFTVCGNGSTLKATQNIRRWLPKVVEKYGIQTVNDAGAGDLAWIRRMNWSVDYLPFDLIPRLPEVSKIDITTETMPPSDAILCRMVLNHLVDVGLDSRRDETRIVMALDRFRESAKYLIATQFSRPHHKSPQFCRLDLSVYLGDPLEEVQDGSEEECRLALWAL